MDPNANLREQLELALQIVTEDQSPDVLEAAANRLADLVLALDEWIAKGGFLPARWSKRA